MSGGGQHARRAGVLDIEGSLRIAGVLDRVPPPGCPGQGDHRDRSAVGWPRRDGIGAGWAKVEYDAYGIEFESAKVRLDQLEEGIQCLSGLLHDEVTDFAGKYFTLTSARNEPRPVQAKLPIWIGGGGEKRTLKIAAQYADGWNVPFIGPDVFAHKRSVLHGFCESVGRDPSEIRCAINVGIASDDDNLRHQFGAIADFVRPGVLTGSDDEILERIGQYVEAGADQLNISLRAPFDIELLERFSAALKLA